MGRRIYFFAALVFSFQFFASVSNAVPYASGIHNTTGTNYEFVLNEPADNVVIKRDGGNELSLGALSAGRHPFDLSTFTNFSIEVSNNAAEGWTETSDVSNEFTRFERPAGLAINKDPSSPYFGTLYVANTRDSATASGRAMAPGLYAMSGDLVGVDLANNYGEVTDVQDTSFFKSPGFSVTGSASSSPYKITLDDGGNVIVGDWSDAAGGVKYASPDLTTGGFVLGGFAVDEFGVRTGPQPEGGPNGGVFSSVDDAFGPIPLHGSITSEPRVTGTLGVDLTLWAMDEDLQTDLGVTVDSRNSIWRWDVGSATDYDINPTLIIDSKGIDAEESKFLPDSSAVRTDVFYSETHDLWYISTNRFDGNEAGLVVVEANDSDPSTPSVVFSSWEFTETNGLDGERGADNGNQDIFREMGSLEISEDGSTLYAHRTGVNLAFPNPTVDTENPGAVLVIPLDENGIPIIELDDGGTPGPENGLDDTITNWDSISLGSVSANNSSHTVGNELEFDAAGNLYTTNNSSERLQSFSPGGNTLAVTGSDGSFSVTEVAGVLGDYNGDGSVNLADYTVWRDNLGGDGASLANRDPSLSGMAIGADDYSFWKSNFGNSGAISAGNLAVIPEPGTVTLLGIAVLVTGMFRRRAL